MTEPDTRESLLAFDRQQVWHPYEPLPSADPRYLVRGAEGVLLELHDGRRLIDGMSSWWSAVLGHRHPSVMAAARRQLSSLPHVMFGGLTHEPAVALARALVERAPAGLETVFFSDSGSVAVEVAMKMAVQCAAARAGPRRSRFVALRHGYHGDTWGAMSVSDPEQGMHRLFQGALAVQVVAPAPGETAGNLDDHRHVSDDLAAFERVVASHSSELCAAILEPVVQGAGGMRFYSPRFLRGVREICSRRDLLLICDEIATGFGRTGRYFACEHADVHPDILCVGKALTAGTLGLAATLTTRAVSDAISQGEASRFMHGPTFMANPLACATALAAVEALDAIDWRSRVASIEAQLERELASCRRLSGVTRVGVLGAIGVVEMRSKLELSLVIPRLVERGVWLRPFGRLLYTMPPYVIDSESLSRVTAAMRDVAEAASL